MKICKSNLCNNQNFASQFLNEQPNCERNQVVQPQNLVLSKLSVDLSPSASKCYACENCNTTDLGRIVNCSQDGSYGMKNACYVIKFLRKNLKIKK